MEVELNCAARASNRLCYRMATSPVKEACAEFLATFVLVVLGDGVIASCVLGKLGINSVIVGAFGWGFALMIAVTISGGVSGGHVNPAVTVSLATVKKCSWRSVAAYLLAQYLASFLAAAVVYFTYIDAIEMLDGGLRQVPPSVNATAQIFATYSQEHASIFTCFLDQVVGTALLLMVICAAIDLRNLRVPPHTQPMIIGLGLTAIILAFGHNCGAPLNPARDFSPRLFTALSGWGVKVFSYRSYEWFWIPVLAPHLGGIVGVWLYKALIDLPFENYNQILQDTESPEYTEEDRRRLSGLDINFQKKLDSPEDEVGKRVLEKVAEHSAKVEVSPPKQAEKDIGNLV